MMSIQESRSHDPLGERGIREHKSLVLAIQRRDLAGASKILNRHLERTAREVKQRDAKAGAHTAGDPSPDQPRRR